MNLAGFEEMHFSTIPSDVRNKLWRDIPNRKWHANMKGAIQASRERLLVHRART